jgi:aspartyl-tRNA synthetase
MGWDGLEDVAKDRNQETTLMNLEMCFVTSQKLVNFMSI